MNVGRNDFCPCGSGRKYTDCCSEERGSGAAHEGPAGVFAEIRQALQGWQFTSLEELQSFTDRFMRPRNQGPLDDFHGLSPEQMHRFLDFPFDSPEWVTFAPLVAPDSSAPILTLFGLLAEAIGERGLKPTATGILPRNLCRPPGVGRGGAKSVFHAGKNRALMLHLARSGEFCRFSWFGRGGADYERPL